MFWVGVAVIAIASIALFGPWALLFFAGAVLVFLAIGKAAYDEQKPTINGKKPRF